MQQRLRRSDEGIEDAVYDSQAIGECIGIDLAHLNAPDDTTLPQFRQLLRQGSAIDATIISAPPSGTKNDSGARDPDSPGGRLPVAFLSFVVAFTGGGLNALQVLR